MLFCPNCGADRRPIAPIVACPQCGASGVDGSQVGSPAAQSPPARSAPGPLPGALTAHIPITPRIPSIVFGVVLIVFGLWAIVAWIPEHRPMDIAELAVYCGRGFTKGDSCFGHWMLNPRVYPWAYVVATLVAAGGLSGVLRGATHRSQKEVTCKRCKTRVVGKVTGSGVECPLGKHVAETNHVGALGVTIAIVVLCGFIWALASGT